MSTQPQYAAAAKAAAILISTANTARDGTGTLGTVFTAGASGSRIDDVTIQAVGTTTAGVVRLYLHNGTTAFLLKEILVPAITPSVTVSPFNYALTGLALALQSGWSLRAAPHNAESFNVLVTRAGDF